MELPGNVGTYSLQNILQRIKNYKQAAKYTGKESLCLGCNFTEMEMHLYLYTQTRTTIKSLPLNGKLKGIEPERDFGEKLCSGIIPCSMYVFYLEIESGTK